MPIIQVKYSTPNPRGGLVPAIATTVSRLSAQHLRKDPKVTAVTVEAVAAEAWFCGGDSLAELGLASFFLDIKIVQGTNTKDEMAAFIAGVYAAMGELLGALHSESYVNVDNVDGYGYGFGGLTQERRYVAGKLGVAA
ncbi:4-oxalocrotonate tautomerase family protein [Ferrovibrio sp.]|uniref:tautomerase family protein n=1 Tax=Ferrovibrio sp. TaxID=1917215 RepID=UPI0035B007F3